MSFTTERQIAEKKVDEFKMIIEKSQLDYSMFQTPYKVSFQVRKRFICDNSPKSALIAQDSSPKESTNSTFMYSLTSPSYKRVNSSFTQSPINVNHDSGFCLFLQILGIFGEISSIFGRFVSPSSTGVLTHHIVFNFIIGLVTLVIAS